jgi:hypothetical protein
LTTDHIRSALISVSWKALLILISLPLWGSPLSCTQGTLADYISLSEGCTVDSFLFSNFGFTANAATSNPGTNDILISPLLNAGDDWTRIRISDISGQFLLSGPLLTMDFEIVFTVSSTPLYPLYEAFLLTDADSTGSGSQAKVKESVDYGSGKVQMQSTQGQNGLQIRGFPQTESVQITKLFNLNTGANQNSTSTIGFVDEGFSAGVSAVPEPTTIVLAGCGLLAISFCRRRSRPGAGISPIPSKTV